MMLSQVCVLSVLHVLYSGSLNQIKALIIDYWCKTWKRIKCITQQTCVVIIVAVVVVVIIITLIIIIKCDFIFMVFVVTGEACGLAMGLVMLGSKSPTSIEEMVGVSWFLS